jgi:Tol biopolymer transport system component
MVKKQKLISVTLLLILATTVVAGTLLVSGCGSDQFDRSELKGKIVFLSDREKDDWFQIYTMNANGLNVQKLMDLPGRVGAIDWDYNTNKIVMNLKSYQAHTICTVNADGTGFKNLGIEIEPSSTPRWSPNGDYILYAKSGITPADIYIVSPDGTGETWIGLGLSPQWSPDGSEIYYSYITDGKTSLWDIYNMPFPGQDIHQISVDDYESMAFAPSILGHRNITQSRAPKFNMSSEWSPAGDRIAYIAARRAEGNYDIYVMNVDGSARQRLTYHLSWDILPQWSPDGSKIAFSSEREGRNNIYIMNADGKRKTRITNPPGDDHLFAWLPNLSFTR